MTVYQWLNISIKYSVIGIAFGKDLVVRDSAIVNIHQLSATSEARGTLGWTAAGACTIKTI